MRELGTIQFNDVKLDIIEVYLEKGELIVKGATSGRIEPQEADTVTVRDPDGNAVYNGPVLNLRLTERVEYYQNFYLEIPFSLRPLEDLENWA